MAGSNRYAYRMPPEWHRHEATWLAWPKLNASWPSPTVLGSVKRAFIQVIEALTPHETVKLLVRSSYEEDEVRRHLKASPWALASVVFVRTSFEDIWIRDYGPNFVLSRAGLRAFNHWGFNAWGGKYRKLESDAKVIRHIRAFLPSKVFKPRMVLEGGSIDVNGGGLCLTTEQCLLNANRNPRMSRSQIEGKLKSFLGVRNVIWFLGGVAGDDTDGHVDDVARFTDPSTLVMVKPRPSDSDAPILTENWKRIRRWNAEAVKRLKCLPLPRPQAFKLSGQTLPASYANFYIGNAVVLVPAFGDRSDRRACDMLKELFAGRRVMPIDCRAWVRGQGTLHCATQQEPCGN